MSQPLVDVSPARGPNKSMPKRNDQTQKLHDIVHDPNKRRKIIDDWKRHADSLFVKLDEFPPTPPPWLVEGFLPQSYLCLLAGDPKSGKTALATAIALAVAQGKPFAGMNVVQSPVLWLSLEESRRERAAVLFPVVKTHAPEGAEKFGYLDAGPNLPLYTCYDGIAIDNEDGYEALNYWISKTQAKLIIVDPLHAAHSGRSLHDGWAARKTLRLLKRLCANRNVTALVLHHLTTRGKQRAAESVQLSAIASMVILLSSVEMQPTPSLPREQPEPSEPPARSQSRIVSLKCAGRGNFSNKTIHFVSHDPLHYNVTDPPPAQKKTINRPHPIDTLIVRALQSGQRLTASEIAAEVGANVNSVRNALPRLLHNKQVELTCIISGASVYAIPRRSNPLTLQNGIESDESHESDQPDDHHPIRLDSKPPPAP